MPNWRLAGWVRVNFCRWWDKGFFLGWGLWRYMFRSYMGGWQWWDLYRQVLVITIRRDNACMELSQECGNSKVV